MEDSKELISSHIFIFPFRWDYISNGEGLYAPINKRLNIDKIVEMLLEKKTWKEEKFKINNDDEYNKYSYFCDDVRDAIYGRDELVSINKEIEYEFDKKIVFLGKIIKKKTRNRIVRCLKYDRLCDNSTYTIELCKRGKKHSYTLNVKKIKLKIYDTGVAALSFFLENYKYSLPEDILNINDYGRRIYPQYLPLKDIKNSFLAEKIILDLPTDKYNEDFTYDAKLCPNRISDIIMKLLGHKFNYDKNSLKKGQIFIEPVIGDRTFTMCIYGNNNISKILTHETKEKYINNDFWYKYVFIDNADPTCQDKEMMMDLLKSSTYTRWKDYGTLYGISRYSFVVLINELDESKFLIHHFNNIYYEIVLLVLIERSSILRLSDDASNISTFNEDDSLQNIKEIQRYYVKFMNDLYFRLYFKKVTAQEQGMEFFNKLVEMMEIEKDVKKLGDEIEEIQKYTSMISNERISTLLRIITYLGLIFTACTFIIKVFGNKVIPFEKWNINDKFSSWFLERTMISIAGIGIIIALFKKVIKGNHTKIIEKIFWITFSILFIIFMFFKHWI